MLRLRESLPLRLGRKSIPGIRSSLQGLWVCSGLSPRAAPSLCSGLPWSILDGSLRERAPLRRFRIRFGYSFGGAGLGAGLAFAAGREMPKLINRKPNPLRSESSTLMVSFRFLVRDSEAKSAPESRLLACGRSAGCGGRRCCWCSALEQINRCRGQRLVGVGEEDAHLPHLVVGEHVLK
jgi:hypothetical protein